jgi:hypothetical protein
MRKELTLILLFGAAACGGTQPVDGLGGGGDPGSADAAAIADAGSAPDAGGGGGDDAAVSPPDAGATPVDAGQAPIDAGTTTPDAGTAPADAGATTPDAGAGPGFSFFVTSLEAMQQLSGSPDGFGGNFGGVEGADRICQTIAEGVGQGGKTWRAFLSATRGGDGQPVHAIERIGSGPWYDANGRLVATGVAGLLGNRPDGDPRTINDLPTEHGMPLSAYGDAHDVVTGSNRQGRLSSTNQASTCNDWTSADVLSGGMIMCGHSFPRSGRGGLNWLSDHPLRGCTPGINLTQNGPGTGTCIGCSGGYGALYCFAATP